VGTPTAAARSISRLSAGQCAKAASK
jgi:hypothetical protein